MVSVAVPYSVPLVGKVTFVAPVEVKVMELAPEVAKVLLAAKVKVPVPVVMVLPFTVAKVAAPAPVTDQLASFKARSETVALPMVMVPEEVPVPMLVAKFEEALRLITAPVTVAPKVPVMRPFAVTPLVAVINPEIVGVVVQAVPLILKTSAPVVEKFKVFAPLDHMPVSKSALKE